jgi:hypothetical protein
VLDKADNYVKQIPIDQQKLKDIKARIAKETALRKTIRAQAHVEMKKFKGAKGKALRGKFAQKSLTIAEKLAAIDVALNETYAANQVSRLQKCSYA